MRSLPFAIALALHAAPSLPLAAQFIDIKTVPMSVGEQFLIYPSRNFGFGGLSLAVRDPLLDPFVNPAKAARLPHSQIFSAPVFYSVSQDGGSGKTLPAGGLFKSDRAFGGLVLTLQQLVPTRRPNFCCVRMADLVSTSFAPQLPPDALSRSRVNQYAFGMLGTRLREGLSIGGSAMYGALDAMDGVELLYPNAASLDQAGHVADMRFGLLSEQPDRRSLEAMFLFSTVAMRHDVGNFDVIWDTLALRPVQRNRLVRNYDRTHTYGLHFAVQGAPRGVDRFRPAASFTANYKNHPQIPNYELMSIPRDPGYSYAYNLGVGIGNDAGPSAIGIEAVLEPIWSRTWAAADRVTPASGGRFLQRGDRTIENAFVFRNAHLRVGVQREIALGPQDLLQKLGIQLGLALRSIRYSLDQRNYVLNTQRFQRQDWVEWTPTWGVTLRFPELDLRYVGRQTNGTGRPGVVTPFGFMPQPLSASRTDVLLAPSGPLTLAEARVRTHQIAISIPIH